MALFQMSIRCGKIVFVLFSNHYDISFWFEAWKFKHWKVQQQKFVAYKFLNRTLWFSLFLKIAVLRWWYWYEYTQVLDKSSCIRFIKVHKLRWVWMYIFETGINYCSLTLHYSKSKGGIVDRVSHGTNYGNLPR